MLFTPFKSPRTANTVSSVITPTTTTAAGKKPKRQHLRLSHRDSTIAFFIFQRSTTGVSSYSDPSSELRSFTAETPLFFTTVENKRLCSSYLAFLELTATVLAAEGARWNGLRGPCFPSGD